MSWSDYYILLLLIFYGILGLSFGKFAWLTLCLVDSGVLFLANIFYDHVTHRLTFNAQMSSYTG